MSTTCVSAVTPIEEVAAAFRDIITMVERRRHFAMPFPNRVCITVLLIRQLLEINDGHRPDDVVTYRDSWNEFHPFQLAQHISRQVADTKLHFRFCNHQFKLILALDKSLDHLLRYSPDSEVAGDILALAVEEFDGYRRELNPAKLTLPELVDKYAEEFGLPC